MHNYSFHSKNLIQYDLLSQFTQSNFYLTPKLKKIVLNFGIKEINFKNLILVASALEVVTTQKAILTTSSKSNIFLKIRKGAPVGCRVDLRKNSIKSPTYYWNYSQCRDHSSNHQFVGCRNR